jgi:hypothetical protein
MVPLAFVTKYCQIQSQRIIAGLWNVVVVVVVVVVVANHIMHTNHLP